MWVGWVYLGVDIRIFTLIGANCEVFYRSTSLGNVFSLVCISLNEKKERRDTVDKSHAGYWLQFTIYRI